VILIRTHLFTLDIGVASQAAHRIQSAMRGAARAAHAIG